METRKKRTARSGSSGGGTAGTRSGRNTLDTGAIAEHITAAITERRLPPGTKLGEEPLGAIFGVSRTKIREALLRLAGDKLVTLHPGRGAFVAQPTVQEAREVFEARRVVECGIIAKVARSASREQVEALGRQIQREHQAVADHSLHPGTRNGTRFLGEFHAMIADLAGNRVLAELARELASRTSLIEVIYESSMSASCSAEEHARLLKAIEDRDPEGASRLMAQHLEHIESCLDLRDNTVEEVDLRAVLVDMRAAGGA